MKKVIAFLSISAVCAVGHAQGGTNFVQSVQAYFTSFNTNYTFIGEKLDLETGYKQVTGVNAASFATLNYHVNDNFELGGTMQYSGVGSPINALEVGGGYGYNYYDTRVTVDLYGGYDWYQHTGVLEPKLEVKKKLTPNTFASLGMSLPYYIGQPFNNNPTFWTGVGFTW